MINLINKMGIPKFFGTFVKPLQINTNLDGSTRHNFTHFYIDFNALIYMAINRMLSTNQKFQKKDKKEGHSEGEEYLYNGTEKMFLNDLTQALSWLKSYMDTLINKVNPHKYLMIFIDGFPCKGKMLQQKIRRYESTRIYTTFSTNEEKLIFSNSLISPSTWVMAMVRNDLDNFLLDLHIKRPNLNVVISADNVAGEGEHKLLNVIRNMNDKSGNHLVYGDDGDLFILLSVCGMDNVELLRNYQPNDWEKKRMTTQPPSEGILTIYSIFKLKYHIARKMNNSTNIEQACLDFMLIMCLMGNDFLPRMFVFYDFDTSLKYLTKVYNPNEPLLVDNTINLSNLIVFMFRAFNEIEMPFLMGGGIDIKYHSQRFLCKNGDKDEFDINKFRTHWYTHILSFRETDLSKIHENDYINQFSIRVVEKYVKTWVWNIDYYLGNEDNDEYYNFGHPPLMIDIFCYLKVLMENGKYPLLSKKRSIDYFDNLNNETHQNDFLLSYIIPNVDLPLLNKEIIINDEKIKCNENVLRFREKSNIIFLPPIMDKSFPERIQHKYLTLILPDVNIDDMMAEYLRMGCTMTLKPIKFLTKRASVHIHIDKQNNDIVYNPISYFLRESIEQSVRQDTKEKTRFNAINSNELSW